MFKNIPLFAQSIESSLWKAMNLAHPISPLPNPSHLPAGLHFKNFTLNIKCYFDHVAPEM
jgi:hypothetical protein